jgi:hypothetical protein
MVLKTRLPNLDGLSPEIAKEYKKLDDESFMLDTETVEGWALDDVATLKTKLEEAVDAKARGEEKFKRFNHPDTGDGLDPDEAWTAIGKVKEMTNWTPQEKVAEKLKVTEENLRAEYDQKLSVSEARVKKLSSAVSLQTVRSVATDAIAKLKGNVKLLMPVVEAVAEVVEDAEGNFTARIKDGKGGHKVSMRTGETGKMGIEEYVTDVLHKDPDYSKGFEGAGPRGSDSSNDRSGGGRDAPVGSVRDNDPQGLSDNIEDIAAGKVGVAMGD